MALKPFSWRDWSLQINERAFNQRLNIEIELNWLIGELDCLEEDIHNKIWRQTNRIVLDSVLVELEKEIENEANF